MTVEANPSQILNVYIYRGDPHYNGVDLTSAQNLRDKISEIPNTIVEFIDAHALSSVIGKKQGTPSGWEQRVVIVFPGGKCSTWDTQLGKSVKHIRSFVERGGNALMICAGAYFGAAESCYHLGECDALNRIRGLDFFPGKAEGPINPKLTHTLKQGTAISAYKEGTGDVFHVYSFGGGVFLPDKNAEEGKDYNPLMRYTNGSLAAVSSKIGKGCVIMSFLHFEFDGFDSEQVDESRKLKISVINAFLKQSLPLRKRFFTECFELFRQR